MEATGAAADNRAGLLNGVVWLVTSVSMVLAIARAYTRIVLVKSPGLDDAVLWFCVVVNLVNSALISASTTFGTGRHAWILALHDLTQAVRINLIANPFGIIAFCLPKLAITLLLTRIMGPRKRGIWFLYLISGTLTVFGILSAIFLFVQCDPPSSLWDIEAAKTARCWNPSVLVNYTYFVGAYSAFCDFCLALFPVSMVWALTMPLKRKIGICLVLGLGVFASAASVVKITTLYSLSDHEDITYATVDLLLWTVVEINVMIICACMPTLGPLWADLRDKELPSKFKASTRTWGRRSDQIELNEMTPSERTASVDTMHNVGHGKLSKTQRHTNHEILRMTEISVTHDDQTYPIQEV